MQHDKNKNKNGEIKSIGHNSKDNVTDIFKTLEILKLKRVGSFFNSIKRCGVNVSDIILIMIMLPFYHVNCISALIINSKSKINGFEAGKDVYYDLKNNEKVNWRSLLMLVALRFKSAADNLNISSDMTIRAFIFDDSPLGKTGKKIELTSRIHDHVVKGFIFGYKILVFGYWDGNSFYPLDFSLHREKGNSIKREQQKCNTGKKRLEKQRKRVRLAEKNCKDVTKEVKAKRKELYAKKGKTVDKKRLSLRNKLSKTKRKVTEENERFFQLKFELEDLKKVLKDTKKEHPDYGLTAKDLKAQYSKSRKAETPGAQRAAEVDMKKTDSLIAMLKRGVKRGFFADYVLTDSWFCNYNLIKTVKELGKKTGMHLISMTKINTIKYTLASNGKSYNAHELLSKYERSSTNARSHKAKYIRLPVHYSGIRVNLFFVKFGSNSNWRLLLTTDLSLNFQKLMDYYKIRWTIEVFFRECKQYLNLGRCKSTCFDSQIADATISLVQYTLLSFHRRIHYGCTFDHIFQEVTENVQQHNIAIKLTELFNVIVETLSEFTGIDCFELIEEIFESENFERKLKKLNLRFEQESDLKLVA